jgi:ribosomal protein L40E
MSAVCPNGHTSQAEDFCDTCGAKIDLENQPEAAAELTPVVPSPEPEATGATEAPAQQVCPNCSAPNTPDALFCEACGYDFTTGALPRGAAPTAGAGAGSADAAEVGSGGGSIAPAIPLEWVAEVWVDPQWYAVQEAEEPMPSPGLPAVVGLTTRSLLIGRVSPSRNIHPDIDCTADTGVSRRHAQLTTDGQRWFVEDLGSSNGTFVGPASGPLPEDPIPVGPRTELDGDDRIYVGAWTRIVVRNATDDEKAAPTA